MAASSVPADRVSGADGGRLVGHLITVRYRRAVDLYARIWEGQPLGDDEYVPCADEKTQLQALRRCHHDLPAASGRIRRSEFEYCRGGTLAYVAAYDPHTARVLGRTAPTTGIVRSDSWSSR